MGEQANSALALGVSISRDASVRAAGGYLVQVRPNSKSIVLRLMSSIPRCDMFWLVEWTSLLLLSFALPVSTSHMETHSSSCLRTRKQVGSFLACSGDCSVLWKAAVALPIAIWYAAPHSSAVVPRPAPLPCCDNDVRLCPPPLQVLPFASEATLAQLEANIAGCPSVTDMLHEGDDARGITGRILAGLGVMDQGFSLAPRWAVPWQTVAVVWGVYGEQTYGEQTSMDVPPMPRATECSIVFG